MENSSLLIFKNVINVQIGQWGGKNEGMSVFIRGFTLPHLTTPSTPNMNHSEPKLTFLNSDVEEVGMIGHKLQTSTYKNKVHIMCG